MTRRHHIVLLTIALCAAAGAAATSDLASEERMPDIRFMTLEPGHFHAALVQKEMYEGVAPQVHVYAPLGPDLLGHLARISGFNHRPERPTAWELEVHTGPDAMERMLREKPGNVVVISGRNRGKIERIERSIAAGLHVLADKPWILRAEDLPALERALAAADAKGVVAYDIMTERYEVTTILQRELVNDPDVFGSVVPGSPDEPAVYMESVHHLMKVVAGAPNIRPWWFFDTEQQGEGLNDVGTHLVDLVQWTLFPEQALDYRRDIRVLAAQRWPTMISEANFRRVTNASGFPEELRSRVKDGSLEYFCNTLVTYALRGIHARLNVVWDWEAPEGSGDTHYAVYRGSKARVEVRQAKTPGAKPELYVVPKDASMKGAILEAIERRLAAPRFWEKGSAGRTVQAVDRGHEIHVVIPDALRVGHEEHFAEVTERFLRYVRNRSELPAWERPNMVAKYYVTTTGTELSYQSPVKAAPRPAP
ncbi:MAG TPA: putative oxidoreductase C-terminal domain-containing protein [Vicinamibacterales bacterium]|nr:putative oxidoreductase C-terminal domain-containing protein [Vicinamibacterales bacterium]